MASNGVVVAMAETRRMRRDMLSRTPGAMVYSHG
jgi:hypothetical protein